MNSLLKERQYVFECKYGIGDIVYLITDTDQKQRIVVAVEFRNNYEIIYTLKCGVESSWHFDIEMTDTKNYKMS